MPTLAPTMNPQQQSGYLRGDSLGAETSEQKSNLQAEAKAEEFEQDKKAMNNVWNSFLTPEPVSFTRLDSPQSDAYSAEQTPQKNETPNFADIYAKIMSESDSTSKTEDLVGTHEGKEAQPDYVPQPIVEEKQVSKMEGSFVFSSGEEVVHDETPQSESKSKNSIDIKQQVLGGSKEVLQTTLKVSKFGFKEGKDVVNAVSDLWKNFIGFREKKPDPKAKENAEKAAKRKANKLQFIGLLKEGMSLYYAAMRKALMELEVKLGVNALGAEDRNRFLGRNRNLSFQGNDSVYAIHQTAYEMMEQKRRQIQSSAPAPSRGKPSAGQVFRDKNLQGERSGGQNMMSAVG